MNKLIQSLLPVLLKFLSENIGKFLSNTKKKREAKKQIKQIPKRDEILRQIEIAKENGNHYEVKRLFILLNKSDRL
jgi:hypothetical protein